MTEKDKPICFIAMAFGHDDTDALYDKQILPVLKRLGIKPIRIDRQQSNDDINIQIIEQLKCANFCITDLTYARQSVYYEAGFAQRTIEVIYSVRSDHLKLGQPDDKRVHFDLQMKPIINWGHPDDSSFSTRLESRIKRTFLTEWERKKLSGDILKSAIIEFEKISLSTRLLTLRQDMISGLKQSGFSPSRWATTTFKPILTDFSYHQYSSPNYVPNNCAAFECSGDITNFISIHSYYSLTKSDLKKLHLGYNPDALDDLFTDDHYSKSNTFYLHHFILSIKPSPVDRIETVLTGLTPLEKGKCYFIKQRHSIFFHHDKLNAYISTWHFLTGIRSEPQLNEMIKQHLTNYFTYPSQQEI